MDSKAAHGAARPLRSRGSERTVRISDDFTIDARNRDIQIKRKLKKVLPGEVIEGTAPCRILSDVIAAVLDKTKLPLPAFGLHQAKIWP